LGRSRQTMKRGRQFRPNPKKRQGKGKGEDGLRSEAVVITRKLLRGGCNSKQKNRLKERRREALAERIPS